VRWALSLLVRCCKAWSLPFARCLSATRRQRSPLIAFSSRANNHDTALPWLLAAPLAVLVFLLVSGLSFALIAWLLGCLFKGAGKGSR
jgi:hypothetical protein